MKIRKGFVSNSSSTSYTCEICGNTESFWDSCDPREFGFYTCKNYHTVCETCLEEDIEEEYIYDESFLKEKCCPICNFEVISSNDMLKYLYKTYTATEEEVLKKVKETNKRRRVVRSVDYISYILWKNNLQELDIQNEIRIKFKDYENFRNYLRGE